MEIIPINLNDKTTVINLNQYIQVQQGDSALPITFVFKYGSDSVDMSDKIGFISGITANKNDVEFENIGNSSGQCIITLNSYAFQDAGAYQWLYVGIKDNHDRNITSVTASLNVLESKLNTNIDTGSYRDDWKEFKDGLNGEVSQLSQSISNVENKAETLENNLNTAESSANSAVSYAESAGSNANSAASYANSAGSQALSAVEQAIKNIPKQPQGNGFNNLGTFENEEPEFYLNKGIGNYLEESQSTYTPDSSVGTIQTIVSGNGSNNSDIIQFYYSSAGNVYYRFLASSSNWYGWHTIYNDNNGGTNVQFTINASTASLLNNAKGTVDTYQLDEITIFKVDIQNATSNTPFAQAPLSINHQQQLAELEINTGEVFYDYLSVDTSGNLSLVQKDSTGKNVQTINCKAVFTLLNTWS